MSYQYPPNNQVDFSWVGFEEYTYPVSTSSDLAWYNYACQYLISIPSSPNINFSLDKPIEYSAPVSTNLEFSSSSGYSAPSNPIFNYQVKYSAPSAAQTDFYLICDIVDIETVFGQGSYTFSGFSFEGEGIHWPAPWVLFGSTTFPTVTSESLISVTVIGSGNNVFTMESSSVIDRGNRVRSTARITSPIVSNGYVEMTPIVTAAVNNIGDMAISSQSGLITVAVYELGQNIQFTDSISHLRGRVIFGYPKANIIRQVYEISNNRSLVIPSVPEDPSYAVFLTTTDFNLTDEELRRGTVDMNFTFDHDLKDIVKVSVWLQTPSGNVMLDKMKIVDYPGGIQDPHLIINPFKYSTQYRIPIHCISKKENEFYIEVEYKNAEISEIDKRSQVMLEKENYIIPFQAHFDNRVPYVNLADHVMLDGPEASSNVYSVIDSSEQITANYCIPDPDVKTGIDQHANEFILFTQSYDEITRIFLVPEDDVAIIGYGGANSNTYFIQEYVDLSSGQIGG